MLCSARQKIFEFDFDFHSSRWCVSVRGLRRFGSSLGGTRGNAGRKHAAVVGGSLGQSEDAAQHARKSPPRPPPVYAQIMQP